MAGGKADECGEVPIYISIYMCVFIVLEEGQSNCSVPPLLLSEGAEFARKIADLG